MKSKDKVEIARDLAIWMTGGVLEFQGVTADVMNAWEAQITKALIEAENRGFNLGLEKYRKLLWLTHGCECLYGDDGEMQCNNASRHGRFMDFKRQPIEDLERILFETRIRELGALKTKEGEVNE